MARDHDERGREAAGADLAGVGAAKPTSLGELALLFLRLGATVLGGPAAHIAVMQDEVVRRRRWLSSERFVDLLGAVNLIPGPNSTELAIHIGYSRRGWPGLLTAGACFILPGVAITAALAWAYVHYGALPQALWLLYGVKPVILAVVVQAIWRLVPSALRSWPLRALAVMAVAAALLGVHVLIVLFGAGLVMILWRLPWRKPLGPGMLAALGPALASGAAAAGAVSLGGLLAVFLKAGALLFGSGYVLLAFLQADLVDRLHWLTSGQLIDAVAVGQITPGPVFSTATFVGYVLAGPQGAAVATVGIFLPAFVFVALSGPLIPRLRASATAAAFLDGVNAAALALMAAVTLRLAWAAFVDVPTVLIGAAGALLLLRTRLNATWLIAGGALAGWLLHAAGLVR